MPRRPLIILSLAGVLAFYALLAFRVLPGDVVYSGDMGVKFVQARALLDNRFRSLAIQYRGAFLDPAAAFTPFRPPFVLETASGVQAIFPPAGAVLDALFVWAGGLYGMRLLSIVGAALTIWFAMRLASEDARPWVAPVLGMATPLWFYGITEWEHAPAMGLGTAAFAAALGAHRRGPLAAGLLVGAAAALRDEAVLLLPGLVIACWIHRRGWRAASIATAAAIAVLALNGAVDVFWFHRPAAAHMQHAIHLLRDVPLLPESGSMAQAALQPLTFVERYNTVFDYWLAGTSFSQSSAIFAGVALAALLLWRGYTGAAGVVLLGLAAMAVIDTKEAVEAPRLLPGFIRSAPFVVFAALPAPPGRRGPFHRAALITIALYLLLAFATVDTMGGKAFGARLLLPLLPLAVVSALDTLVAYANDLRRGAGLVMIAGAILLVCAGLDHVASGMPAWTDAARSRAARLDDLLASDARVVVADDMYTAQLLLPFYYRRIVLLADTPALGQALGSSLAAARIPSALVVTRRLNANTELPPYTPTDTSMRAGMLLQLWRR